MLNPRVFAAIAVLGAFAWWFLTREDTQMPVQEQLTVQGEPRSAAGKKVEAVRQDAQKATDQHAERMKAAEPEE